MLTLPGPKILYLVHDLNDPGVARRVAMLRDGGAHVIVFGFYRGAVAKSSLAGAPAVALSATRNGNFIGRIGAVIWHLFTLQKYKTDFAAADIIIARNLEMLALAVRGCALTRTKVPVVYEVLDIHRLMVRDDMIGMILRTLEGWLGKRADLLITSSPAFVAHYFRPRSKLNLPIRLIENKVYNSLGRLPAAPPPQTPGPPWVIGWFGAIRCRKSLAILKHLVAQSNGQIQVIIRGRPAYDQFENFDRDVSNTPGLQFMGPYQYPDDLALIYGQIHFTYTVDYFEEGLNSSWLLPNRLYEGGAMGRVPIALAPVATGAFLEKHHIGVRLQEPLLPALQTFFSRLTPDQYHTLAATCAAVPRTNWVADQNEMYDLVAFLSSLKEKTS